MIFSERWNWFDFVIDLRVGIVFVVFEVDEIYFNFVDFVRGDVEEIVIFIEVIVFIIEFVIIEFVIEFVVFILVVVKFVVIIEVIIVIKVFIFIEVVVISFNFLGYYRDGCKCGWYFDGERFFGVICDNDVCLFVVFGD